MAVFYSFHYERDSWRVQMVMSMGKLEGQPLLNSQQWEEVKAKGSAAIKSWIDKQMKYKSAVVVLVGSQTATRPWVIYEIEKAWDEQRPLVGIRIHGLRDNDGKTDTAGTNPFELVKLDNGKNLSDYVTLHSPTAGIGNSVYADIMNNVNSWVDDAYKHG